MSQEMHLVRFLKQLPWFSSLATDECEELAECLKTHIFEKETMIFREGEQAERFYVLVEGKVKIYKGSRDGRIQILHLIRPLEMFGEAPAFEGGIYPAFAETMMDSVCVEFPRDKILELIRSHPEIAMQILGLFAKRLRLFTSHIEQLTLKASIERFASFLLQMHENFGARFVLDMSRMDLANLLGTSRENLARNLQKLEQADIIRIDGRKIEILHFEKIKMLSLGIEV